MRYSINAKNVLNKIGHTVSVSLVLTVMILTNGIAEPTIPDRNADGSETLTIVITPTGPVVPTVPEITEPELPEPRQECMLAVQLKDPYVRAEYTTLVAESRSTGDRLSVEDMYSNIQTASYSPMPSFSGRPTNALFDPISMECVVCHDGTIAKPVTYRISDGNLHREKSITTIKGAHPIGMDYEKFTRQAGYAPSETLPEEMVLIDGKVGCATCHNMLDNKDKYLVVDISSSNLCLICHNK